MEVEVWANNELHFSAYRVYLWEEKEILKTHSCNVNAFNGAELYA